MNNEYNLANIENLRIHELRDFARKVGVTSPTTMKKDELVARISNIINTNDKIDGDNKHIIRQDSLDFFSLLTNDNSNLISSILKSTTNSNSSKKISSTMVMKSNDVIVDKDKYLYPQNEYVGFSFSIGQNEPEYHVDEDVVEGYLDIHPSGYGIVRYNGYIPDEKDVYITSATVKKYRLLKGCKVRGRVKAVLVDKPKIMYEIENVDMGTSKLINFDEYGYNKHGNELYLNDFDFKIHKGDRYYIGNLSFEEAVSLGKQIQFENAINVKMINIKAMPEDNVSSNEKFSVVNCVFSKTEVEVVNTCELIVERIKREFENKKSNVLIIYNFSELIRVFNAAIEGFYEFNKFSTQSINRIKNILNTAKFYDKYMNVTIICVDKNGIPNDIKDIMNLEIMPIFNMVNKN